MSREKKTEIIDSLQELFSRCSVAILTDYRGQAANEMTQLRRRLREAGVEYKVVKNTLARFAAQKSGREELFGFLDGPVAIAFGYGDISEPAKALATYIDESKATMSIKGGFLPDRLLTKEEVITLSALPSKEVLLARVVGGVQGPISALVGQLASPMMGLIAGLQARILQLEGG
ncbi:MAG: 50S ribosomal protein L10 [Deltaproteobacteria bacterium]|nr:50S ribosomal protein L10 [Deltaproteobacteria bacterium]